MANETPINRCDFCGRSEKKVSMIFTSSGNVRICDECVTLCYKMLNEKASQDKAGEFVEAVVDEPAGNELSLKTPTEIKAVLDEYIY